MTDPTPGPCAGPERTWQAWARVTTRLAAELQRALAGTSLSLADLEVLGPLAAADDGRLRVTSLAEALGWERSRVSHQVARMEARGLVDRHECPSDRRGAFVRLSVPGREAVAAAGPLHRDALQRLLVDPLGPDDVDRLGEILARLDRA